MNHQEPPTGLASPIDVPTGTVPRAEAKPEDPSHDHIKTDHLLPDLKRRTVTSGFITISAQAAKFGLNLACTVVLARLLMLYALPCGLWDVNEYAFIMVTNHLISLL